MFSGVSNITNIVDNIFLFFLVVSIALFGLITFLMVYFVIKYNRKRSASQLVIITQLHLQLHLQRSLQRTG